MRFATINMMVLVAGAVLGAGAPAARAQNVVYENLGTAATAGTSRASSENPIFGDALTLTASGQLTQFGFSIYNSTTGGNTGSILTGSMVVNFYDDTVPYTMGVLSDPLLGTATIPIDFTAGGGLAAGFYATPVVDLTSLSITLPLNIFVTQQFTLATGTSNRNGLVLFSNPTIGSSPATVYMKSSAVAEGLYAFASNPNQFGYHVEIAPAPGACALLALGGLLSARRRRG